MSQTKKILVDDPRSSKISTRNDVSQVVKSGMKNILHQEYTPASVNSNNVHYSIQIPSNDTLTDRSNVRHKAKIQFYFTKTITNGAGAPIADEQIITGAPCAFPLNTICDSVVYTLNGVNYTVPLKQMREMLLKQYDQKTISEFNNTCPSYVDQLYANFNDAANDGVPYDSNPLSDSSVAIDDVMKRGAYPITYQVKYQAIDNADTWTTLDAEDDTDKEFKSIANARNGVYVVQCTLEVNEPILAGPFEAFSRDASAMVGIRNVEIKLHLNDCRNIYNDYGEHAATGISPGVHPQFGTSTNFPLGIDSTVRMCHMNIHDSQYGKVKAQNTFSVVQYTGLESPRYYTTALAQNSISSNIINLGSIPDKFYIQVRVPYQDQSSSVSNFKGFSIKEVKVTMNNVPNLLADRDKHELYLMSKKNGCQQSWQEFDGKVVTQKSNSIESIGSYLVIDPVMDLGLSDMLSSGSLGTYSVQFHVTFDVPASVANLPYELLILYTKSSLFNTKEGVSSMEDAYLTKDDVLNTKTGKGPSMDYEQFTEELSGAGRRKPLSLTDVGSALNKAHRIYQTAKDVEKEVAKESRGGGYEVAGGGIDKYLAQ